jgi:hypothetical protein
VRRVRTLHRSLRFRKNRFLMRRLTTVGYRKGLHGRLVPASRLLRIINRPLRNRIRRSKPLRRSLRRKLLKARKLKRRPVRYTRVRSSTGRILSTLKARAQRRK